MNDRPIRYQPSFFSNDTDRTVKIPWPEVIMDQNRISIHLKNIQWLAHDFGGILNPEKTEWTFEFEQEEYNCVIRYLTNPKFEWKRLV